MKARFVDLVTEDPTDHRLRIMTDDGQKLEISINASQIMVLAQQTIGHIWSYYKLVPRG